MPNNHFDRNLLDNLRNSIRGLMSSRRFEHTLGVEKMACRLGELFCPDKLDILSAAALLHDITKELTIAEQEQIYKAHCEEMSAEERLSVAIIHSKSASLVIPEKFPRFACDEIISAVRWHTTGRENMSLVEKLIYLADYIDETRDYADCIALRNMFFDAEPQKMSYSERIEHLNRVLIHSFDITLRDLVEKKRLVNADTVKARNSLILNLKK